MMAPMNLLRFCFTVFLTCTAAMAQNKAPSRTADETVRIWQEGDWKGELPGGWKIEGGEKS